MDFMMQMMFMARNAVPDSVREAHELDPTASQMAIGLGDYAIALRDEGLFGDMITLVQLLDPSQSTADDWEDRVSRHYAYCEWISNSHGTPEVGWFSRAGMLPIDEETADSIHWHLDNTPEDEWGEKAHFPVADRAYRTWTVETADRIEGATPVRCESCMGHQVVIDASHTNIIQGSGLWKPLEDGRVVLVPTSRQGSCTVAAKLTCQDCSWSRELDETEVAHNDL